MMGIERPSSVPESPAEVLDFPPLQRERMKMWFARSTVVLIVAVLLYISKSVFKLELNSHYISTSIGLLVVFAIVSHLNTSTLFVRAAYKEVRESLSTIHWLKLYRSGYDETISSISVVDIIFSVFMLASVAASTHIIAGHIWISIIVMAAVVTSIATVLLLRSLNRSWNYRVWIFACAVPVITANVLISSDSADQVIIGSLWRLAITVILTGCASLIIIAIATTGVEVLFGHLIRIIPCRSKMKGMSPEVRAIVTALEALMFGEIAVVSAASAVWSALLFHFHSVAPNVVVFIVFDLSIAFPVIISSVIVLNNFGVKALFYIQRIAVLYALCALLIVNIVFVLSYSVTWLMSYLYISMFGKLGKFFFPDFLYYFRDISPASLPFSSLALAAGISAIVLLSISWTIIVVRKRAWKEVFYMFLLALSMVSGAWYAEEVSAYTGAIRNYFGDLSPTWLGLIAPAILGIFTKEFDDFMKTEETLAQCKHCGAHELRKEQRFCIECGTALHHSQPTSAKA